jgi:hypothetical protein
MDEGSTAKLTAHQAASLERIRACEASGMSLSAYAAEQGLDVRSLYDARKVLKAKGLLSRGREPVRFQRAKVAVEVGESQWRIQLPNGAIIEWSGAVDGSRLSTVLSAVAKLD